MIATERAGRDHPRIISLPCHNDVRGLLTVLESDIAVPFQIRRVFFIEGIPPGTTRAGHAHRTTEELIVALTGVIDVSLEYHAGRHNYRLSDSGQALYVPRKSWLDLNFPESGSTCLVLASQPFDEDDYIRDRKVFSSLLKSDED
jgi:hypothetical protein